VEEKAPKPEEENGLGADAVVDEEAKGEAERVAAKGEEADENEEKVAWGLLIGATLPVAGSSGRGGAFSVGSILLGWTYVR
jgi:hypothetical protein